MPPPSSIPGNKSVVNTLQIISTQHELAMAIGTDIDLEIMLKNFLHVSIKRLRLISAHVFLNRDDKGWPETRTDKVRAGVLPEHFLSIPVHHRGEKWGESTELLSMVYSVVSGNTEKMEINGALRRMVSAAVV